MESLELRFGSGESSLSVRRFAVHEAVSSLFSISIWARSPSYDIDFETLVGKPASLRIVNGIAFASRGGARLWTGVCSYFEQVQAEPTGLSTYFLRLVPSLWLLTQRRDHRVFQHLTIPDIADRILARWSIAPAWRIDRASYPKLDYRIQYGESDYDFVTRLFAEAGIAFTFPDDPEAGSTLTLSDRLHEGPPRATPLPYVDSPNRSAEQEFVTRVRLSHEVRPGAYTIRDHDFRNPQFALFGTAPAAPAPEDRYEQYHYHPGAFRAEAGKGGDTPVADDKGVARHDEQAGSLRAERALHGERSGKRHVAFETNAVDLWPGVVFSVDQHPHDELASGQKILVTDLALEGGPGIDWSIAGRSVFTDVPHRPLARTTKPLAEGVQSATVVGPAGQEIHTDEFGRVRIQMPWDREGQNNDESSCWVRVSQGWAGAGFGQITIPRIGHEVLVGFLAGDPDQPIIVGRVFNAKNTVPYPLPQHQTRSTWKSDSSPGSGGSNEILMEDLKGSELVYVQAEKNLRKLVKNDETITVGNNRGKLVKGNETETTAGDRTEATGGNRTELTDKDRTTIVGGTQSTLVKSDRIERTEGDHLLRVGGDQHIIVHQTRRELVEGSSHLRVGGNRSEQVGSQSLSVGGDQHEKIGRNHLSEAIAEIHFKAGTSMVLEAPDITIKSSGGFVRVDAGGVTIQGTLVNINSGGSPGLAPDAKPGGPEKPREAEIAEPPRPEPDDVSKTGLAQ